MNQLRLPNVISITGTIAEIKTLAEAEYEVLRRDSIAMTIVDFQDNLHTVWVSNAQVAEYGLESKMFLENIVTVSLNENVEGETYYMTPEDTMEPHEATFNSFVNMISTPPLQLALKGVPQFMIEELSKIRAQREASVAKPVARFHAKRGTTAPENTQARIDSLLDRLSKTSNPAVQANIKASLTELGWKEEPEKTGKK